MRIISLYGHGDCGKSETLNALKELLRENGKSISAKPHPWCEMPETFEYKVLVVCVTPAGDNPEEIDNNIRYFEAKKCDVAITGSRTKGEPVNLLKKYAASKGISVEWVQKSYEYNLSQETQVSCNKETAEVLLRMI